MEAVRGNIWDLWKAGFRIVITTNIGWDDRGVNNMGAGTALEAWRKWPTLAEWYGEKCRDMKESIGLQEPPATRLVLLPVKPLRHEAPAYSWDQTASLALIRQGLYELRRTYEGWPVALTLPGAGNGRLDPAEVYREVRSILGELPNFVLVDSRDDWEPGESVMMRTVGDETAAYELLQEVIDATEEPRSAANGIR